MNDIEIALEDLDTLVEIARQHTKIASWLGLVQSALIMKEALEKQLNGGWIPCKVRLPEEFGCYLVAWRPTDLTAKDILENTGSSPHYYEILAFEPVFVDGWDDIEQCDEYEILAWQPLPEPYKEAENE